jgi:hypothetical protein
MTTSGPNLGEVPPHARPDRPAHASLATLPRGKKPDSPSLATPKIPALHRGAVIDYKDILKTLPPRAARGSGTPRVSAELFSSKALLLLPAPRADHTAVACDTPATKSPAHRLQPFLVTDRRVSGTQGDTDRPPR